MKKIQQYVATNLSDSTLIQIVISNRLIKNDSQVADDAVVLSREELQGYFGRTFGDRAVLKSESESSPAKRRRSE